MVFYEIDAAANVDVYIVLYVFKLRISLLLVFHYMLDSLRKQEFLV